MVKPFRVFSIVALTLLAIAAALIVNDAVAPSLYGGRVGPALLGTMLSNLALVLVLLTTVLGMVAARQNQQRHWFLILLLLLLIGVPGPYVVFLVLAGIAGENFAAQFGSAYLVVNMLCPLVAAVGALIYSFHADPYARKWDRSEAPERPVNKWEP